MKTGIIESILAFVFLMFLTSCPGIVHQKFKYAPFPDSPVNMGNINSEYDDYNSASPVVIGNASPLCFSSNRNSQGQSFSIINKFVVFYEDRTKGKWYCEEKKTSSDLNNFATGIYNQNINIRYALTKISSPSSKLGPYLVPQNITDDIQHYVFLYADNESGNFDIRFTQDVYGDDYSDPVSVAYLNSPADDYYPVLSPDSSQIYFCSNRDGNFNIYKTDINLNHGLIEALQDTSKRVIVEDPVLSSSYNDKCPFILGTLLVFTSDRPGGYGGFDLYYSEYSNGAWSAPVNFGNKINTSSDEYRPILRILADSNTLMIFSSNRPGGKGGFDLYYVGIDKMTGIANFN